jgi:tripartite-type tricarboxylate transporter receptor subunit TctC
MANVLMLEEPQVTQPTRRLFTRRHFNQALIATLGAVGAGAASAVWSPSALAQSYPARPLTMIAPYPAGGGIDSVARLLAERLGQRLNQTVTVDNKPGAGATLGATAFARSPADGYTLMLGSVVDYAIAPHVHKSLPFDMQRDFIPVVEVGLGTVALIVNADLPAASVKELIALAKAKPGSLSYASSGIGGLQHLNAEMFKQMAGADIVHVPYKGTAALLPDLIAGRVQMAVDSIPAHLPHVRSGKTRALAVASRTRSPTLPDVPTMAEAGLPGYESATNYTLFVPAKTPAEAVAALNRETNAVLQLPEVIDKLAALGVVVTGGAAQTAQARMASEIEKWAGVIRRGNLTLN